MKTVTIKVSNHHRVTTTRDKDGNVISKTIEVQ
jgi:hypothetical protein